MLNLTCCVRKKLSAFSDRERSDDVTEESARHFYCAMLAGRLHGLIPKLWALFLSINRRSSVKRR